MSIDDNSTSKISVKNKYFTFLKNTEKVPNSWELLELKTDLHYNESQSAIRNAKCQICSNIATNPKMCEECEVLYCGNCASTLLLNSKSEDINCRNCPEPLNLKPLSKSLKRILDDFDIQCPSMNLNCPPPISYKNLISHLDECRYWQGFSKCLGCGLIGKTHSIEDHITTCPFVYFKCDICSNIVKRKDIEVHQETCKKLPNCEMCKILKNKVEELEDKLIIKINSLEDNIEYQQKSILLIFSYEIFI